MSVILIGVLAFAAVTVALYPLFRTRPPVAVPPPGNPAVENLLSQREATYGAIKDLEFDRAQGKLSEADYTDLRAKYETKALAILQQLHGASEIDAAGVARPVTAHDGCPSCGTPFGPDDLFCRACGNSLSGQCPVCSASTTEGDQFCRRCGSILTRVTA